jgi:hypothetical protein
LKSPFRAVRKDRIANDRRKASRQLSVNAVPMGVRWPPQRDQSEVGSQGIAAGVGGLSPSIRVSGTSVCHCLSPHWRVGSSCLAKHTACPHIGRSALAVSLRGPRTTPKRRPYHPISPPSDATNTLRSQGDDVIHHLTLQPKPVGTILAHTWQCATARTLLESNHCRSVRKQVPVPDFRGAAPHSPA